MIRATNLTLTYRTGSTVVRALDGINLDVAGGTVHALLGPNGAGKTTTVKCLTTLVRPDSGHIDIRGIDVLADPRAARRVIGASGQYAAVDENMSALENLEMIGRLYHLGRTASRKRANELVERFDLTDAATRPVKGFSGGMRRRVDLAGAIVANPRVLFLDEPTTGLDPRSRQQLWTIIESLVDDGATVLLTTQYLEEADRLADQISVINAGRVIAEGTADQLKADIGGHRVEVTLDDRAQLQLAADLIERHTNTTSHVDGDRNHISASAIDGPTILERVLSELGGHGVRLRDAGIRRPTLDDVFLALTDEPTGLETDDIRAEDLETVR